MKNICLICDNDRISEIKIADNSLLFCNNCGIHYNKDIPSEEELNRYYAQNYVLEKNEIKPIQRYMHRLPESVYLMSIINKYKKAPANILDIGCDKGFFINFARHFGYNVQGVEPSENARSYCKKLSIDAMESIDDVKSQYDLITMWHSLEHFPEPKKTLNKIDSLLAPNGILMIRVPDFGSLSRKIFGGKWIWFQPQNHYFHYSSQSLSKLIDISGFELLEIKSGKPNNLLTLLSNYVSNRAISKNFKIKPSIKQFMIIIYEYFTGVELFAICKKKNIDNK